MAVSKLQFIEGLIVAGEILEIIRSMVNSIILRYLRRCAGDFNTASSHETHSYTIICIKENI